MWYIFIFVDTTHLDIFLIFIFPVPGVYVVRIILFCSRISSIFHIITIIFENIELPGKPLMELKSSGVHSIINSIEIGLQIAILYQINNTSFVTVQYNERLPHIIKSYT